MRSKLFVPGVRPELFAKALAGKADALSFDLEDSVPAQRKAEARALVSQCVQSSAASDSGKIIIVRTNALDSPYFEADLQAVALTGTALINLPKIERADDILAAVALLEQIESQHGVARPIRLLINIETPRALRAAASLAGAHPRVAGLQLGLGDLFEPLGVDRRDAANIHATLFAMRMAAAEAGVFACDSAFANVQDTAAFRTEAMMARGLGYIGKSCIHPSQVGVANAVFRASDAEIAAAQRIVEAAQTAESAGRGAFVVDGRMIDPPFLRRAEAILASLRDEGTALGQPPPSSR